MYQTVLTKTARKELETVDQRYRGRIVAGIESLRRDPYQGKVLGGKYEGLYSMRIWPYRILYKVKSRQLIIYVIGVRHRQGAYR
jgi:mRNA-degrading endonuclease RelE of RelBE toxin-antitoxin system